MLSASTRRNLVYSRSDGLSDQLPARPGVRITMSNAPTTPVRLKDIARDLNVSVMTVSKVVRGCADVGAETRSRVLARIKELNYQPNWVARSLAARRTFMIGLIVPDLMHSFFAEIAKGVSATIRPLGYDVVICNSEEDGDVESSEVDRLLARQVDGLLLASAQAPSSLSLFERIEARGVPYVLIDRRFADAHAPYVGADDEAIGRLATQPPDRARMPPHRPHRRPAAHHRRRPPEGLSGCPRRRRHRSPGFLRRACHRRCQRISRRAPPARARARVPTPSSATTIPPPPAP